MSDPKNNLPRGWVLVPLGEIVHVNPRWMQHEPMDGESVSFLRMAAVEAGSGRLDPSASRMWKEVKKGYTRFQERDVLFAKITPCMENGKAALAVGLLGGRGAGSTEFHVLRPIGDVRPKFVLHFLLQEQIRRDARMMMKGAAGQLRVPPEFLEGLNFPLPPAHEQGRIVDEMEKQFTRLEAGVGAIKRVQANLKRYRAAVLKAAVEGRLVPTEAELARREGRSYEPASELLKRLVTQPLLAVPPKPKSKEPVAPDTANLPKLPEGWTWAQLNQLLVYMRNGISQKPDSEDGTPILRINAVRPRRVDMNEVRFLGGRLEDYADYVLQEGDLLFTRYNGNPALTGVCGMIRIVTRPTVHPDKLIRVKIVPEICLPAFAEVVLSAGASRDFIAGRVRTTAGQAGISGEDIRSTPIPLAPLSEQSRIVAEVERRLSVIDEVEMQVEANLKRAERLRQAILKRAFEGKLVPQDPNDEPASMLLERIKGARRERT
jgi:type I restriction enzyme S subunit